MLDPNKYEFACRPPDEDSVFSCYVHGKTLILNEQFFFTREPDFGVKARIFVSVHLMQGDNVSIGNSMVLSVVRKDNQALSDLDFAEILAAMLSLIKDKILSGLEKENILFVFPELKGGDLARYVLLLRKNELESFHRP